MLTKIKRIHFHLFFGLVATGIISFGDCLSDSAIDDSGTQQCYNIADQEVCYFVGSEQLSVWHMAYEICERNDSTLPIIRNASEQMVFEEYLKYLQLKRSSIAFVWTAGKRNNFNDWIWINGQPLSTKVKRSLQSRGSDDTHVQITKNHSFRAWDPDSGNPFLCQFYGERCLLSGGIKLTNSCVIFSNYMDSWFNARSNCLAREGDLAVLSDQDLQILKNYYPQLPVTTIWIGLRNMGRFWYLDSDGKQTEEIKYKKFKRNVLTTSGEECLQIEALSGAWIKTDCIQKRSVICQRKGNTQTATTGNSTEVTERQSGCIAPMTFAISIAGVVLVCIAFSAIVGIIAARHYRKASSSKCGERNIREPKNVDISSHYYALQQQSVEEDLNELRY